MAAYHLEFRKVRVTEKFELTDGTEFELEFAEPALLISELVSSSAALSSVYDAAIRKHGRRDWRLIVAFDEFAPGNKLRVDNRRKAMNCFISFLELGQHALGESTAWAIPLVVRHVMLQKIPGGWARVLRMFLDRLLFGPHGVASVGMAVEVAGETAVIHARLHCVLADGEGLMYSFDWRGSSSLKPCLTHFNVVKRDSDLATRQCNFVEITCSNPKRFQSWPQAEVTRTMSMLLEAERRVAASLIPKRRLGELSMVYGLNPNPHSLWAHPRLSSACTSDLVSTITYDWVHSLLQDGAWSVEAWQFLRCCESHGVTSAAICTFLKDDAWKYPSADSSKSTTLWRIFDSFRSQSSETANKLKASSSECLGLCAMLRHFVDTRVSRDIPELAAQRASFDASCRVLATILWCKRGFTSPQEGAHAIQQAVRQHMELHVKAYGSENVRPKHHWLLHVAPQYLRDGLIIDTFIVERGHLLVKSIADLCKYTDHFEGSVLAGVINRHRRKKL